MASAARARVVIVRERRTTDARERRARTRNARVRADSRRRDRRLFRATRVRARADGATSACEVGENDAPDALAPRVIELEPTCEGRRVLSTRTSATRAETTRSRTGAGTFPGGLERVAAERAARRVRRAIAAREREVRVERRRVDEWKVDDALVIVDDNMYYHGMRWKMFRDARGGAQRVSGSARVDSRGGDDAREERRA